MKAICLSLLLAGAMLSVGCATPAYSAHERSEMISRNINMEGRQMTDDFDTFMLLRPVSHMTLWNVR